MKMVSCYDPGTSNVNAHNHIRETVHVKTQVFAASDHERISRPAPFLVHVPVSRPSPAMNPLSMAPSALKSYFVCPEEISM